MSVGQLDLFSRAIVCSLPITQIVVLLFELYPYFFNLWQTLIHLLTFPFNVPDVQDVIFT
jgi:hypothetical protein